jgi:hypothetical protein
MDLEPIRRREFSDPDRAEVQERVAHAVESGADSFLDRYARLEQSLGGRYISADLFKETFEPYNRSKETRNRYNTPVHNAAAVLASEQLRRVLAQPAEPGRDAVVLLTGIPGAGKTSAVLEHAEAAGELPRHAHAVYEGQMADRKVAIGKVQEVIDAGFKPVIVAVHARPERALENTLQRFDELGRGAGIEVMARVQGDLPEGLAAVHERFGDAVELRIIDRREFAEPTEWKGWEYLSVLRSEGNHEQIKQRLTRHLERQRERLTEAAWRQAAGLAPLPDRRIDAGFDRGHEASVPGRTASQEDRQEALLSAPPTSSATSALERLHARSEEIAARLTAEHQAERAREEGERQRALEEERRHETGRERKEPPVRDRDGGFELES